MWGIYELMYIAALSTLPFTELRASLPLALTVFKLPPLLAYVTAVVGNMIPVVVLLALLPRFALWSRAHSRALDAFFRWWFGRVIRNYQHHIERWGALALIVFVAIPLPMTGAWTGSVAAYLFNVSKGKAFIYILTGVMIAGVIVLLLTQGARLVF